MDFPIVKFLSTDWMKMPNADAVEEIFEGHFFPFLLPFSIAVRGTAILE
jgi:hypothetical protein